MSSDTRSLEEQLAEQQYVIGIWEEVAAIYRQEGAASEPFENKVQEAVNAGDKYYPIEDWTWREPPNRPSFTQMTEMEQENTLQEILSHWTESTLKTDQSKRVSRDVTFWDLVCRSILIGNVRNIIRAAFPDVIPQQ